MLLLALPIALAATPAAPPAVDGFVGVGAVFAEGEGSGAPVPAGAHALFRGRGIATAGRWRLGGELDERSTRTLASRKSILAGGAVDGGSRVVLLGGVGVVERGLFGPDARWDIHVPVELVVAPGGGLVRPQLRARIWATAWERSDEPRAGWLADRGGAELAASLTMPTRSGWGPRLETGWRQEFGHNVWLMALGLGS